MEHMGDDHDTPPVEREDRPDAQKPSFDQLEAEPGARTFLLEARRAGAVLSQLVSGLQSAARLIPDQDIAGGLALVRTADLDSRLKLRGGADAYFAQLATQAPAPDDVRLPIREAAREFAKHASLKDYWRHDRETRAVAYHLLCTLRETSYTACKTLNLFMGTDRLKYQSLDQQIRGRIERMPAEERSRDGAETAARDALGRDLLQGYPWDTPLSEDEIREGARAGEKILARVRLLSDTSEDSWRHDTIACALVHSLKQSGDTGSLIAGALQHLLGHRRFSASTFDKLDASQLEGTYSSEDVRKAARLAPLAREAHRVIMAPSLPRAEREKHADKTWAGIRETQHRLDSFRAEFEDLHDAIARRGRTARLMHLGYGSFRDAAGEMSGLMIIDVQRPSRSSSHDTEFIKRFWDFIEALVSDLTLARDVPSILSPCLQEQGIRKVILRSFEFSGPKGYVPTAKEFLIPAR